MKQTCMSFTSTYCTVCTNSKSAAKQTQWIPALDSAWRMKMESNHQPRRTVQVEVMAAPRPPFREGASRNSATAVTFTERERNSQPRSPTVTPSNANDCREADRLGSHEERGEGGRGKRETSRLNRASYRRERSILAPRWTGHAP